MRGAPSHPQGESVRDQNSTVGIQTHYRFTRQPVKYHRHHNPGYRFPNPSRAARHQGAAAKGHPGSADSSRSSSPEPGAQTLSQNLDPHSEKGSQTHQTRATTESKGDTAVSPRHVVQYMLGLDSTSLPATSTASVTSSSPAQGSAAGVSVGHLADLNINHSNNRQSVGQSQTSKTLPPEHKLTSPAQKILTGLKLRRSHSGKEEQLFV